MATIVFIDDEKDLLEIYHDLFTQNGVTIHTFSDTSEAIDKISGLCPQCIFIDYRLPGITGPEVALRLPLDVDKYLLTGDGHVELGDQMILFKGILAKPLDDANIHSIIRSYLQ